MTKSAHFGSNSKLWAFQGHSGLLGRPAIVRDDA